MGFSVGGVVNSVANISSRKSDQGKKPESSLYEFLTTISKNGVQVKANYEAEFKELGGFQFFCQSINIPGVKTHNSELFYKGRAVQVPILAETEHDFSCTILNDAHSRIYTLLRRMLDTEYYYERRLIQSGYTLVVKARGDQQYGCGANYTLRDVRITGIGQLDFSHADSTLQTFTINGYASYVEIARGKVKKSDGILGKVDKVSNKISNVLGK